MSGHGLRRIAWHAKSFDPRMASVRLRLLEPMAYLKAQGLPIEAYDKARGPEGYSAILFSKSFSLEAVAIAERARDAGRAVLFDICDNLFAGKARHDREERIARARRMMCLATQIVFSTATLAEQMLAQMPEAAGKARVIPDALEIAPLHPTSTTGLKEVATLQRFLARHEGALHCVWFGKSQGQLAGFAHIDAAAAELRRFAALRPVTLTIISNARWRYWLAAPRWGVRSHYMQWRLDSFGAALAAHDVAIIPIERNGYTLGKTINRPATAVVAGLGVIADAIPSYEELRPYIVLDDWRDGLNRYAFEREAEDALLAEARAHLEARYSREAVGRQWEMAIADLMAG